MRNLPLEVEEDKVGLGVLPVLESTPEDNLVPGRTEIAKEMTDILATFRGRCTWKRKDKVKLSSLFVEEEGQTLNPIMKQLKEYTEKCTNNWPNLLPQEKGPKRKGETRIIPVEVRRDKFSEEGKFLGMHAKCSRMHTECSRMFQNVPCMQIHELACTYISLHAFT